MKKLLLTAVALALATASFAQVEFISGYNFGQFIGAGAPSLDGTTGDSVGSIGANWTRTTPPPLESGGGYIGTNGLTGNFSNGTGRLYWDGSNGSTAFDTTGFGIVAVDVGANSINGRNVYNTQMFLGGDDLNLALGTGGAGRLAFVTSTLGYSDYNPDSFANAGSPGTVNDSNLTFAASTPGADVTITWFIGTTQIATTVVSGSVFRVYAVDLPPAFYGLDTSQLIAQVGGNVVLDNIQFNGVTGPVVLTYWKGGNGTWTLAATPANWRNSFTGTTPGTWETDFAKFGGTAGTVTIDNTAGAVTFTGARFSSDGYVIDGQALTTNTADTRLEIGDGFTATIVAPLTGTGGVNKTENGTLILSGANNYAGTTTVTAGTLMINGNQSAATGAVSVVGGRLGGSGTIGGAVTVQDAGTLVGRNGSVLTLPSLTLSPNAHVAVSLGAPSSDALFQVNGALTLDGTLDVTDAGNFGPGVYRLFNYTGALTNNTLVLGAAPVSLGDLAVQTSTANQVNLVFQALSRNFWSGNSGTWTAANTSTAWKNFDGTSSGPWLPQQAIFQGAPGTVTVDNTAGAVTFTGAQFVVDGFTVAGAALTTNTAATALRVGDGTAASASTTATISAAITGTGGIDKTDFGTLVLSRANTYTGATTVSSGRLILNGDQSAATGAVTVASGATLSGAGRTGGTVTIAPGATLIGNAGSTLTTAGLTLGATSNLDVTLGSPSTTSLFRVNGDLTLDGVLNVRDPAAFGFGLYRLIDYTGTLTNNGLTIGALPTGIAASDLNVQTSVAQQVNLIYSDRTFALPIWQGGSGIWSVDNTSQPWGTPDASTQGGWRPGQAIFARNPGNPIVNTSAGEVIVTGVQFAVSGYVVTGDALTTNTLHAPFRVGDGTPDGANMTATITSRIVGKGGLNKTDLGTLILSGNNTYLGDTTLTSGVLQIAIDNNIGADNATLIFNGGTLRPTESITIPRAINVTSNGGTLDQGDKAITLSGLISGTGPLRKNGTGVLTITRDNSLTGTTTITQGGILLGGGSLGPTNILSGARLTGSGTIRGNLANSGLLSPGTSPGTINVTGNFTQAAGATYVVELASLTSYDKLVVSGSAALNGTLRVVGLGTFTPVSGQTYKIIEAAAGVTGSFATIDSPWAQLSATLRFQTQYNAKDVTLAFQQKPLGEISGSLNQTNIAEAVDATVATGALPALRALFLAMPTEAEVTRALLELSPQRYERWFEQAVYSANATARLLENRLAERPASAPTGELWMELARRESNFDATDTSLAAEGSADGIFVGGDNTTLESLRVGAVFGYTEETLQLDTAGSVSEIERFTGALYSRYDHDRFFVEGSLGGSFVKLASSRRIEIPGYTGTARSANDSSDTFFNLRTGLPLTFAGNRLTPYVGLNYVDWSADGFEESGARETNLTLADQSSDSLATRVGLTFSRAFVGEKITFTPRLDIAWRQELNDESRTLAAEIGGESFSVTTRTLPSSGLVATMGLHLGVGQRFSAYTVLAREQNTSADEGLEASAGIGFRF